MPLNTLYLGDCLELFHNVPTGSVDMVLADLPFGTTRNKWDVIIPFSELWPHYKRILKPSGVIALHAADPFTALVVMSQLEWWKETLIWEKNIASNFLNARRQHLRVHENIVIFSPGALPYTPQMLPGEPYKKKRKAPNDTGPNYGAIRQRTDIRNTGERFPTSVLRFSRETGLHPTQKPVALCEYLIKTFSPPGGIVLDNCMGSGTTAIAAINTGRNWCGMEKTPAIFQAATERINAHLSAQQND